MADTGALQAASALVDPASSAEKAKAGLDGTIADKSSSNIGGAPALTPGLGQRTKQKPRFMNRKERRRHLQDSCQHEQHNAPKTFSESTSDSKVEQVALAASIPNQHAHESISKSSKAKSTPKALNFAPQPIESSKKPRPKRTKPAHVSQASPIALTERDLLEMTPEELLTMKQEAMRKKLEREANIEEPETVSTATAAHQPLEHPGRPSRAERRKEKISQKVWPHASAKDCDLKHTDLAEGGQASAAPRVPRYKLVEDEAIPQPRFQAVTAAFPNMTPESVSETVSYDAVVEATAPVEYSMIDIAEPNQAWDSRKQASRISNEQQSARPAQTDQHSGSVSSKLSNQIPHPLSSVKRGLHGRFLLDKSRISQETPQINGYVSSLTPAGSAAPSQQDRSQRHPAQLAHEASRTESMKSKHHDRQQDSVSQRINATTKTSAAKQFFDSYIDKEAAQAGLESGKYLKGILRIPPKSRKDAWVTVTTKTVNDDFLVEGDRARNRALNGDEVVIEIINVQNGTCKTNGDKVAQHEDRTRAKVVHILASRPLVRIAGIIRPPGWDISAKETDERAILANSSKSKTFIFQPQDNRVPFIILHPNNLPENLQGRDWVHNVLQKQKTLFAARITGWSEFSRFPRGCVVSELGTVGNIEAETAAILTDLDVDTREHPPVAMACLPATPWSISQEEIAKRRDFRKDRVCTIDPETARDLDDALSVKNLGNGKYEIGVHIADVSHFIEQDSALDLVARDRATTVYMVQRAIPMLPRLLCEELCSLNPAVDRLAFSVTWTMDADGNEVGPRWYGRSIIRSAVRFAYGEAQNLLDGKSWAEGVDKPIDGGHTEAEITQDVKTLLRMSKAMRAKRFDNGALTINAFKLNFKLDRDGIPGVAEVYELKDANRLIEEFMLKANISVAEKIVDAFPEHALLRMHPPPKDRPLQEFVNYASRLGIDIDASSSSTLQEGFVKLGALAKTNPVVAVLQNTAVRSMRRAEYICTGLHEDSDTWSHYALAVPLYTHFTSPIRRYADVVVHRLLDRALRIESGAALQNDGPDAQLLDALDAGFFPEACEAWAKNCNVRKDNARAAQERSSMLYLCAFIEETCKRRGKLGEDEGYEVDAIIVSIKDRSLDIVVPSMALEKRIYYDKALAIGAFKHDEEAESVTVTWRTEAGRLAVIKARQDAHDAAKLAKDAAAAGVPGTSKRRTKRLVRDEQSSDTSLLESASVESEGEAVMLRNNMEKLAISSANAEPGLLSGTTTLKAMSRLTVWLRGNFDQSPCEIDAGLVLPSQS